MKRKIVTLFFLCLLLLTSCKIDRNTEYELITPKTIYMGNTSLEDFKIKLSNGEEINVDEYSKLSFFKEGSQTFTIVYKNVKKSAMVEVIRKYFLFYLKTSHMTVKHKIILLRFIVN